MKRFSFLLSFLVVFSFTLLSQELTVSPISLTLYESSGSSGIITVTSNTSWSAIDNVDWLDCSPTSGTNNGTVTVTTNSINWSTIDRSAIVTISGTNAPTRTVTVIQEGRQYLLVDSPPLNVAYNSGSSSSFEVESNATWNVTDDADWLDCSPTTGTDFGTVTVTTNSANTSGSSRSATVTVSAIGTMPQWISVTQESAAPTLTVSPASLTLYESSGSSGIITVTSNISWSVSDNVDWLDCSPINGTNNGTVTVTTNSINWSTIDRSATVTISGTAVPTRTVTVIQEGRQYLLVDSPPLSVAYNSGSSSSFEVESNATWNVTDDADWLDCSPTTGTDFGTVTVTTNSSNTSGSSRTATVTVEAIGTMPQWISVTQESAAPTLTVSPASLTLYEGSGSSASFTVTSNTSWSLSDNTDWLDCSPTYGSNNGTVTVTANSNNWSTEDRTATVTIWGTNAPTRTVTVIQEGHKYLTISPATSLSIAYSSGSSNSFEVSSNTNWVVNDDASWLDCSPSSGSGNSIITVTANSANTSGSVRIALVTVSGSGVQLQSLTVTQELSSALTVSPTSLSLNSGSGGSDNFTITSNTSWSVSDNASWLDCSPTSGTNNGNITVTANSANTSTSNRTANVTVTGTGVSSQTVTVTQNGGNAELNVSTTSLSLNSGSGGSDNFTITSNTSWSVSDNASWLDCSPTSGTNNGTVTVTTNSANASTSSRTATVTVSGTGVSSQTITVTQHGQNADLTVDPSSRTVSSASGATTFTVSSNVDWSVDESTSWLTATKTNGTTLTIDYEENDAVDMRSASITLSGPNVTSQIVSLNQNGANAELSVEPTSQTVNSESGTIAFTVSSNIDWAVDESSSWLTATKTNKTTLTVDYDENTEIDARSAGIIASGDGVSSQAITLLQLGSTTSSPQYIIEKSRITVFPNPVLDRLYIKSNTDLRQRIIISIYNKAGRLMYSNKVEEIVADGLIEINISSFTSGAYILHLTGAKSIKTQIIIKQ